MNDIEGRIKNAIEFLKDNQTFKVGELLLGRTDSGNVSVTGFSRFYQIENITKSNAVEDLNEVKNLFKKFIGNSLELRDFLKDKKVEYNLFYDDNGKCSKVFVVK